jgi:hypothetical protein
MDATPFFVMMSAVAAANVLSFGLIWAVVQIVKEDKERKEERVFPLVVIAFTGFFIAGGIYLAAT